MSEDHQQRFGGIERLYGTGSLGRLARAHVCVIGLGGVGSWAVEALARSGMGALTLVDADDVCVSNVNRQLHAMSGAIGRSKAEVLAERVHAIQPACRVSPVKEFFRKENAERMLATPFDFVIDAIDGVTPKAHLIASCKERKLNVITCGGSGGKRDPQQIRVKDLATTHTDRLLFFVRKKLRHQYGFPAKGPFGVPCVHSAEHVFIAPGCHDDAADDPFAGGTKLNCEGGLGAAAFVTGAFGFQAAAYVVNAVASTTNGHE
jgi:tRNA A37 threonylcarbamoyladenosine dehydratase